MIVRRCVSCRADGPNIAETLATDSGHRHPLVNKPSEFLKPKSGSEQPGSQANEPDIMHDMGGGMQAIGRGEFGRPDGGQAHATQLAITNFALGIVICVVRPAVSLGRPPEDFGTTNAPCRAEHGARGNTLQVKNKSLHSWPPHWLRSET